MPARVTSSGSRVTRRRLSANSSAQIAKSGRTSSPITEIPDEGANTTLRRAICIVFADAQKSTAAHRKAIISLRKIQEACCYEPISQKQGQPSEDFEESDFNTEFVRCVLRILPVKKAEAVGDRTVRFLGTFLNTATSKDNEIFQQDTIDPDATSLPETPTSRLTTQMLNTLLPVLQAKDKTVRFRATQIISHVINSLDTLDDGLFQQLRFALLKRIHDKEAPVRLQAVYGLGRLVNEVDNGEDKEDSDSDDEVGSGVLEKLLDTLQNDPSAEVRRNLLLNLPLTKDVLPYLLERARDADGTTRRALYARLLPALGDFRHLSLTHREKLLRWGLRDRDENVKKATARLFRERWIEDCAALPAAQAAEQQDGDNEQSAKNPNNQAAAAPSLDALLELLERIDVVNSGGEGGIALVAMREFWEGRPDYVDYVSFPDSFWDDLSPELAFVARTFNDYCRTSGKEGGYNGPRALDVVAEERLPEVTKFGFLLEREINRLINSVMLAASDEIEDGEEELAQREFVVEQMLHMALTFDYSDEVGRRKVSRLMREALALPDLPEEVTRLVVEVLRLVCGEDAQGEREFCGVVLEAIAEVHDTIMGDHDYSPPDDSNAEESFHSATSTFNDEHAFEFGQKQKSKKGGSADVDPERERERAVREIMVNMKCLHIALCMLQNVQCELEENVHLVTMLNNLVVPAVRSQEAPIRERGLLCLGLCCLLGENLAKENLTLFLHCFTKGHATLQTIALQIITDILIAHRSLLVAPIDNRSDASQSPETNEVLKPILKAFNKSLKSDDPAVQATGATALSKLMLSRVITDTDLLKQLVVTYFDPDTISNSQLRQSLAYFLPVYCHSHAENAARMASITCAVISKLTTLREAFLEDADAETDMAGDGMVKLNLVGQMILDWTDPRRIVGFAEAANSAAAAHGANETHFVLAQYILERMVTSQVNKEEKKVLFSILGKLHLPVGGCHVDLLKTVLELLAEAIDTRVASDESSKKILSKLQTSLLKLMHDAMTNERGGGGAEETILDTTKVDATGRPEVEVTELDDEEDEDEASAEQTQRGARDFTIATTTAGFGFTIGLPDAEGTRIQIGGEEDTDMMDVDDE